MKTQLEDVREEIDYIIDGVLVELMDEHFLIKKVFVCSNYHYKSENTIDVYINKENRKGFKISEIQSKVLTLVDLMKRRYDAKVSYQTYDEKRDFYTYFPLFKYNKINRFRITITIY